MKKAKPEPTLAKVIKKDGIRYRLVDCYKCSGRGYLGFVKDNVKLQCFVCQTAGKLYKKIEAYEECKP